MSRTIKQTPIIHHFAELGLPVPGHFNQSLMLRSQGRLNMFTFKEALYILCKYHEMLRATWDGSQLSVSDETTTNSFLLLEHDLRKSTDINADILPLANQLQSTIDIANGPMMHVAVFHLKDTDAILFAIHHLVVDGVSWRIIMEDLNKIYTTLLQGKLSVGMPKRKCSFMQYADAINDYAQNEELASQLRYWTETVQTINSGKDYTKAQNHHFTDQLFELDEDTTHFLLTKATTVYNADINALFLAALSKAWKDVTGEDVLSIAQECHGREAFGKVPLSLERLVGWFTSIFPVALTYTDGNDRQQIETVNSMLHTIPAKGFGYGVLRHTANHDELKCNPLMTFNYLGSFDESNESGLFAIDSTLPQGNQLSEKNTSDTPLNINCAVAEQCLSGAFTYDTGVISKENAKKLCDEFVNNLKSYNIS